MSSLFTKYGMDIDTVFTTGNGLQSLSIYDVGGVDIGEKYIAGQSPFQTGIFTSGADIQNFLATETVGKLAQFKWSTQQLAGSTSYSAGAWSFQEMRHESYINDYINERWTALMKDWQDEKAYVTAGSKANISSKVSKNYMACKCFWVKGLSDSIKHTGVRIAQTGIYASKGGIGVTEVRQIADSTWGFIVWSWSNQNGYCWIDLNIYAQTVIGEYLLATSRLVME